MQKGFLHGTHVPFVGSWFWGMMLSIVASGTGCTSGLGTGYGQNSLTPVFYQEQPMPQGQVLPFGVTPQGQSPGNTVPPTNAVPPSGVMPFGQPVPPANVPHVIDNNAILPNKTQATYNTATQEVRIPFEIDTSRLLAFSVVVDNGVQTLTVIDPINRTMCVYHVYLNGPDAGRFELMSGRNISADLKFDEYNAMRPLPWEMRTLLEQKNK